MKKGIFEFKLSANAETKEIILYHPNGNEVLFHLKSLKGIYYSLFLKELIKIGKRLSISYQEETFNKEKIVKELLEKIFIAKEKYSFQEIEIAGLDGDKDAFGKRIEIILKKWNSDNFLHNFSKDEKEYYEKLLQDKLDKSFEKMKTTLKSRDSKEKRNFFEKIIKELNLAGNISENSQYLNFETINGNNILKIKQDLLNNHLVLEIGKINNNSAYTIDLDGKDYFDEINLNFSLFISKIKTLIESDENLIKNSNSFDELFANIKNLSNLGLQGSGEFYSSEELIQRIDGVRKGKLSIISITRTNGLRNKVGQLLDKEQREKILGKNIIPFGKIINFNGTLRDSKTLNEMIDGLQIGKISEIVGPFGIQTRHQK